MSKKAYNKKPLSYQDQLELLKKRGLIIPDENKALRYLQEISYYRLSAFFLPYQQKKDTFNRDTFFNKILDTYCFDRELRLLIFDCIERIEVAIRTQIIYFMAHQYSNSHWQDDKSIFKKPFHVSGHLFDPWQELQDIISRAKKARHPEVFIKHYKNTYDSPKNPPSWMCLELLTMGELSRLYNGIKDNANKQGIASFFNLHHNVFTSWLHTLTYVRNICAHHSRLWNRELAIKPDIIKKPIGSWVSKPFENNKRIFYFLCIIKYLLQKANLSNSLKAKLEELINKYPDVPIQFLGIPSDGKGNLLKWQNEPLWK